MMFIQFNEIHRYKYSPVTGYRSGLAYFYDRPTNSGYFYTEGGVSENPYLRFYGEINDN